MRRAVVVALAEEPSFYDCANCPNSERWHRFCGYALRPLNKDRTLQAEGVSAEEIATYPRDPPKRATRCEKYGLPWFANEAVRVMGLIDKAMISFHDVDAWWLRAAEFASSERDRILNTRMKSKSDG